MNNSAIGSKKRSGLLHYSNILLGFLYLLPLMDTFNGMMINTFKISGLGSIYRILFLGFLLYGFIRHKLSIILFVSLMMFGIFLFIQYFVSRGYGFDSVELTVKLFTPILMIQSLRKEFKRSTITLTDIEKLYDWLSVVFPLTIMIPYALGLGYSTYRETGYKAFYYATNEITFAMCTMIMYNWHKLIIKVDPRHVIRFIICITSCVLIGTKISLGVSMLFITILIGRSLLLYKKDSGKRLILHILIILAVIFMLNRFSEQIQKIVNRWIYNQAAAENTISFFFSHRNVYFSNGYDLFKNMGLFTRLFGWGLGGANNGMVNIEMDFFDLLFSCGYVGLAVLILLYAQIIKKLKIRTYAGWLFILISFALSTMGGHLMFTGLGGMSLALLFFYSSVMEPISEKRFLGREGSHLMETPA